MERSGKERKGAEEWDVGALPAVRVGVEEEDPAIPPTPHPEGATLCMFHFLHINVLVCVHTFCVGILVIA